ncbi:lipoate--protein ligase [Spirochaeta isovalerica]|uniref:Lipoate-protein ligase A n=1 Tax=Spirochaeta isovalerica TaxID=150 RepID=A0A841RC82_9SPIO|nr:lipoate--protein ligase [Spirochaeta isovalerica]MBB6480012.1 lipoate-protein ligase A [Spirochaeta isovalerica]
MKVFFSEATDPFTNLSIEKWLLKREDLKNSDVLLFYRNAPSVILGRFQNPWLECDLRKMEADEVTLVRRESGGGTVYHDQGNMNFSFIENKDRLIKEEKTAIVVAALTSLGIEAAQGERNDIYIDGKKISGSAGRYTAKRALHHGTLLIETDLKNLNRYLLKKDYKSPSMNSRGTASIPSEVTNILYYNNQLVYREICESIIEKASASRNSQVEIVNLKLSDIENREEIKDIRATFSGWEWTFGKTPTFTFASPAAVPGNGSECLITVKQGLIEDISFRGETGRAEKEFIERYMGNRFDHSLLFLNPVRET